MNIFSIISLLGGLAMFLYGIEVMGNGLKSSSSAALKRVLEKATTNVLLGVLTGTLVTAVIQSSTATIVLTVALIGAGILNLKQAVSIVMGANIGTTITAQIIRLMDVESNGNIFLEFCKPDNLAASGPHRRDHSGDVRQKQQGQKRGRYFPRLWYSFYWPAQYDLGGKASF